MTVLYQFPPVWGLSSMSPFCSKVDLYLRMRDIPFELGEFNPGKAPKGKAPYIEHEGEVIADSSAIIEYFEQRAEQPLDEGLSDAERAGGHLLRRTIEESLYFAMLYQRWVVDAHWQVYRKKLEKIFPAALGWAIAPMVRRSVLKTLNFQGIGRHDQAEVARRACADIEAIAHGFSSEPFFFGERPRTIDATLGSFLGHLLRTPFEDDITRCVKAQPALVDYLARVEERWYPELGSEA